MKHCWPCLFRHRLRSHQLNFPSRNYYYDRNQPHAETTSHSRNTDDSERVRHINTAMKCFGNSKLFDFGQNNNIRVRRRVVPDRVHYRAPVTQSQECVKLEFPQRVTSKGLSGQHERNKSDPCDSHKRSFSPSLHRRITETRRITSELKNMTSDPNQKHAQSKVPAGRHGARNPNFK